MFTSLTLLLAVAGCARQPSPEAAGRAPDPLPGPVASAALVYDPPLYDPAVTAALDRGPRERGAFVGFDELTTSYIHLRIDDRQSENGFGRFERRAIIHRVGKSYR